MNYGDELIKMAMMMMIVKIFLVLLFADQATDWLSYMLTW